MAWNPATDEFGISYSGYNGSVACGNAPFVGFVRLRAGDGFLFPRTIFGCSAGTYFTDVAVNTNTGRFVMGWSPGGGILFQEFDAAGNGTANTGLMSGVFGGNDNFSLDFNPVSGTFLGVGQHNASYEIAGVEANTSGFPIGVAAQSHIGRRGAGLVPSDGHGPERRAAVGHLLRAPVQHADRSNHRDSFERAADRPGPAPAPAPTPTPAPTGGCTTPNPFAAFGRGRVRERRLALRHAGPSAGTAAPPAPTPAPAPAPTGVHDAQSVRGASGWACA